MGDYFQVIVDRDATLEEAPALGALVLARLVERGIVLPTPTDCVLGSPLGYPPGPNYEEAVEETWPDDWLTLWTNGLDIITKRTVFHAGQGGLNFVCNACQTSFEYDREPLWDAAILEWYDNRGLGLLTCPHCGHVESVADWGYDPPWGFGNLGFELWNWPELSESFVEEVSRWLGHRTVVVYGKL